MKLLNSRKFWIIVLVVFIIVVAVTIVVFGVRRPPSESTLENGTYSFYGDTFTLLNGQASIQGHSFSPTSTPLIPIGYTYVASAEGDISNTKEMGSVVAMYRGFGANIVVPILFAGVMTQNGTFDQTASSMLSEEDSKIQSVNVADGIVTLNLLVISAADQNLPHYEQTPTQPISLKFRISNGQFVPLE